MNRLQLAIPSNLVKDGRGKQVPLIIRAPHQTSPTIGAFWIHQRYVPIMINGKTHFANGYSVEAYLDLHAAFEAKRIQVDWDPVITNPLRSQCGLAPFSLGQIERLTPLLSQPRVLPLL